MTGMPAPCCGWPWSENRAAGMWAACSPPSRPVAIRARWSVGLIWPLKFAVGFALKFALDFDLGSQRRVPATVLRPPWSGFCRRPLMPLISWLFAVCPAAAWRRSCFAWTCSAGWRHAARRWSTVPAASKSPSTNTCRWHAWRRQACPFPARWLPRAQTRSGRRGTRSAATVWRSRSSVREAVASPESPTRRRSRR